MSYNPSKLHPCIETLNSKNLGFAKDSLKASFDRGPYVKDSLMASFDRGPYGGFFYRKCEYNSGFIDLATENVNITVVL